MSERRDRGASRPPPPAPALVQRWPLQGWAWGSSEEGGLPPAACRAGTVLRRERTASSLPPAHFARRIRDLNDEINKLIREKSHWERRIVELGGPNYAKIAPKVTDSEGKLLAEASGRGAGYRYFGAAKQLPGVKELFEKDAPRKVSKEAGGGG